MNFASFSLILKSSPQYTIRTVWRFTSTHSASSGNMNNICDHVKFLSNTSRPITIPPLCFDIRPYQESWGASESIPYNLKEFHSLYLEIRKNYNTLPIITSWINSELRHIIFTVVFVSCIWVSLISWITWLKFTTVIIQNKLVKFSRVKAFILQLSWSVLFTV